VSDNVILDLTRLREAFEDDTDGIVELLEMALQTGERHITAMREGLTRREATMVARAAHSIKGSASKIGALEIAHVSENIEELTRAERWSDLDRVALDLDEAYARLRERIADYRAEVAPQPR